jgi:hypothetical protein
MSKTRTHFFTFFYVILVLAAAPSVTAQESDNKEAKKSPATTVDAWRQALPPEAETVQPLEEEAASVTPQSSRAEIEKNLLKRERRWMDALKLRDASALSQIISNDFTFVSPRLAGAGGNREKYFEHVLRDLKLTSYDLDELTVRVYGRAAVVSSRLKQLAAVAGEDWGGTYLVTDVWVNRDGTWWAVSRHSSLLPEKK